jgi:hypothetical protein
MKIVRHRDDARLLPSRHDFALFRLVAYLRLRRAQPGSALSMFVVDRHQSAVETWTVGLWLLLASSCYLADAFTPRLGLPLALFAGFVVALTAVQAGIVILGLTVAPLWKKITRSDILPLRVNSFTFMLMFVTASGWAALRPTWVRFVGWSSIGAFALNIAAAAALYLLRDSVAHLEASVLGGAPSER